MRFAIALATTSLALAACTGDAQFDVKTAGDPRGLVKTVSVLGVYKDGRFAPDTWGEIGPRIARALGSDRCEAAIGPALAQKKPQVYEAALAVAQNVGITETLLDRFAAAADGDAIVVVSIAGKILGPQKGPIENPQINQPNSARGRQQIQQISPLRPKTFEMKATLYVKSEHKTMVRLRMLYSGTSADEAVTAFTDELAKTFPGGGCSGWNYEAPIDAAELVKSIDEPVSE